MITKIEIRNYRCYSNSQVEGFKRFNLIGGLNNSGKTVLLEAILLNSSPTTQNVAMLKQLRGESIRKIELPEYTWDNFFINQDKNKEITITSYHTDKKEITLRMYCNEEADDFNQEGSNLDEEDDTFQLAIKDFVYNENYLKSVLHFKYKTEEKEIPVLTAMAHGKGINMKEFNFPLHKSANFIPASIQRDPSSLAREYGITEKRKKEELLLKALQIIDNNIEGIKVSVVGGAHLEIKRRGGSFMPLSLYGDAVKKIVNITLTLINNDTSILLIDEIENGIHHTVQRDFWYFLFSIALKEIPKVQIFATSHSLEMMQAFNEVSRDFEDEGAYFELYRRKQTGKIDYNLHDSETLFYELSNKLPIRGE